MELTEIVRRSTRLSLGVAVGALFTLPFVKTTAVLGLLLGLGAGLLSSWLLLIRIKKSEGVSPQKAVQGVLFGSVARLSMAVLALFIAFSTPGLFDLLATGLGLFVPTLFSYYLGAIAVRQPGYWEKIKERGEK